MAQKLNHTALQALKPKRQAVQGKPTAPASLLAAAADRVDRLAVSVPFFTGSEAKSYASASTAWPGESKSHVEMGLEDARDKHRELRRMVMKGENPATAKQKDKQAGRFTSDQVKTVEDLFDLWFSDISGRSENSQRAARGWWDLDIKRRSAIDS